MEVGEFRDTHGVSVLGARHGPWFREMPYTRPQVGHTEYILARRRVDAQVASWWSDERTAKGSTGETSSWEEFKQFLRARFLEKSRELDKVVIPEEVVPLRGLNMQLKRVHDGACMTADRGHRWNLFQMQCMIKGKACKLMIDSGSYCNGISKAVVETLG